jgi:hypothetical protein
MTTSHRSLRFLTFLTATGLLLLGPVAFGASISAADEPAPDVAATPLEPTAPAPDVVVDDSGDPQLDAAADDSADQLGETAAQGGPGGTGRGAGGPGSEGGHGDDTDHGDEGEGGEEGDHGEESAVLVCLATTDPEAPYTSAMVMPTAIINGEGRVKKEGPANSPVGVAPTPGWGNIVPEVAHPSGATFGGLNFDEDGSAIWDAGCGPAAPPDDGHEGGGHGGHATVTLCIATEDSVTPYEVEEWMVQEIINGHGMPKKDGPASDPVEGVFPDDMWGNIIPVVTHPNKKATYDGLNWDAAGQAIWAAGCVYVVPAEPAPAAAPAAKDFCPDLDGFQWENYDCNTPQAVAAEAAVPTVDVVTAEPAPAVVAELAPTPASAAMPAEVSVPTEQTIPTAVDAGEGSSDPADGLIWLLGLFVLSCLSAAGSAARFVSSGASLR